MKPGVQYPHWDPPRCAISSCTGCSAPGLPRPSAVTSSWPSSESTGTRHALSAVHLLRPSTSELFTVDHNRGCRHGAVPSLQVTVLARATGVGCARTADWVNSCPSASGATVGPVAEWVEQYGDVI